jgi:hypothetical protein
MRTKQGSLSTTPLCYLGRHPADFVCVKFLADFMARSMESQCLGSGICEVSVSSVLERLALTTTLGHYVSKML